MKDDGVLKHLAGNVKQYRRIPFNQLHVNTAAAAPAQCRRSRWSRSSKESFVLQLVEQKLHAV